MRPLATDSVDAVVPVGRIGAPFGVRGWVRVRSDMELPAELIEHRRWSLRAPAQRRGERLPWVEHLVVEAAVHGDGVVARLDGVGDRDSAGLLRHYDVGLPRGAFSGALPGEYFWVDLVGLPVTSRDGQVLGTVDYLMETGSNDVLVVRGDRERLVPFIVDDVVLSVTLRDALADAAGSPAPGIVVDWDPDF